MKINSKVIFGVLMIIGVVIAAGIFALSGNKKEVNAQTTVSVDRYSDDWGEMMMDGGNKEADFEIRNDGNGPLVLNNVITSCMCTTAVLSFNGKDSPVFGMHTKSGYQMSVPAGESAALKVVFDPAFHGPSGIGPITRQVKVNTNDPANPTLTFTLTGTVIK